MPELPEVETVRRGLEKLIVGRRVLEVDVQNLKSLQAAPADVKQFLIRAEISAVRRRAKMLILDLSTGYSLIIHLKMTGQIVFRGAEDWGGGHPTESFVGELPDRSTRVEFELGGISRPAADSPGHSTSSSSKPVTRRYDPSQPTAQADQSVTTVWAPVKGACSDCLSSGRNQPAKLFFNDQRKFGWIRLVPTAAIDELDFVAKLGPEPLTGEPYDEFLRRIRSRNNTTVKAAILDQTVVAGIGNIYADESLWGARVHPATRVHDLSDRKLREILAAAIDAMQSSLRAGGSTMKNYVKADGTRGNYLDKFANVFSRDGEPCPRCGTIIVKIRVAGRGTHVCPRCQKLK
jgi:formamidopyrimidine-DNA glycosylase